MKKVLLLIKILISRLKKNLHLVQTAEELIEVFKLRSEIYTKLDYTKEFTETIEGISFDKFDKNAAILFCSSNEKITGTTRLIFDSSNHLPTEKKTSFKSIRNNYQNIAEISRLIVKSEKKGLNLEFKNLMQGLHTLFTYNDLDVTVFAILKEHYKLYKKFGGIEIIKELNNYGKVGHEMYLVIWDTSQVSKFFTKAFLT